VVRSGEEWWGVVRSGDVVRCSEIGDVVVSLGKSWVN
jgi:hypothetical protein